MSEPFEQRPPADSTLRPGDTPQQKAPRTRRSTATLVGLVVAAIVLIFLLVFILQNSTSVTVHFLGLNGRVPLGVALLLSAIGGMVLVSIPAAVRIVQLRRAVRRGSRR